MPLSIVTAEACSVILIRLLCVTHLWPLITWQRNTPQTRISLSLVRIIEGCLDDIPIGNCGREHFLSPISVTDRRVLDPPSPPTIMIEVESEMNVKH